MPVSLPLIHFPTYTTQNSKLPPPANGIEVHKKSYDENVDLTNVRLSQKVEAVATAPDPVGRLARSIAPEIFGHSDVKRAMLLQLVGGVSRKVSERSERAFWKKRILDGI